MSEKQEVLLDDALIEKEFNDALAHLQKSLGSEAAEDKGTKRRKKSKIVEDENQAEGEDEDEMDYEKSISDILDEDPDAAAAMDVEPFLRQLAKAMDKTVSKAFAAVEARLGEVKALTKSVGEAVVQVAKLEKSVDDKVSRIGGQPVPSSSARILAKSRFGGDSGEAFDNKELLLKSRQWVRAGAIDLTEAAMIEGRIGKGTLGTRGDLLDQKVAMLAKDKEA